VPFCSYLPPMELTSQYDRFRDQLRVELDRLGFGPPIPVGGTGICYYTINIIAWAVFAGTVPRGEPLEAGLRFVIVGTGPATPRDVILLVNGNRRLNLGQPTVQQLGYGPTGTVHLTTAISPAVVEQFRSATAVEIAVGSLELNLDAAQVLALQSFARRLTGH